VAVVPGGAGVAVTVAVVPGGAGVAVTVAVVPEGAGVAVTVAVVPEGAGVAVTMAVVPGGAGVVGTQLSPVYVYPGTSDICCGEEDGVIGTMVQLLQAPTQQTVFTALRT